MWGGRAQGTQQQTRGQAKTTVSVGFEKGFVEKALGTTLHHGLRQQDRGSVSEESYRWPRIKEETETIVSVRGSPSSKS